MEHARRTHDEDNDIADRVAHKLDKTTVEGRQPMPRARHISMFVFGATFVVAAIIVALVGYGFDQWLGLGMGLLIMMLIFIVFGWSVIGPMMMRMREETQARRQTEHELHPREGPRVAHGPHDPSSARPS